jgi:tetratricopeptide (TPR) repeat protein
MRPGLVLVLVLTSAACAATRPATVQPTAAPAAPAVDISGLLRRGCFRCFEQALAAAQSTGDADQAFEAAALIVLRAKELGLPVAPRLATLRQLLPPEPGWSTLLDIVVAMPTDPFAGDRYAEQTLAAFQQRRRASNAIENWRAALGAPPGSDLFRAYLDLAIVCQLLPPGDDQFPQSVAKIVEQWRDAPAIQFRAGTCSSDQASLLTTVRAADPDFVDAEYPMGRQAAQGRVPDLDESLRHLQLAHEAFPDSLAIATVLGNVRAEREEWADALPVFDDVIARLPTHRDALLGRTISLSHLRRHDEAIAAATRMIDLGEWLLGEAYYWRAWNELQLKRLDEAAVDRDRAKTLMSNAAVYVLSGLIDWGRRLLPDSEGEFQQALTLDFGQCDAALYLGAVRYERAKRPEALAAFKQAVQCYDLAIGLRRKLIDDIRAGGGSESGKARLVATHERAIAEATAQREQAARDAATVEKTLASSL